MVKKAGDESFRLPRYTHHSNNSLTRVWSAAVVQMERIAVKRLWEGMRKWYCVEIGMEGKRRQTKGHICMYIIFSISRRWSFYNFYLIWALNRALYPAGRLIVSRQLLRPLDRSQLCSPSCSVSSRTNSRYSDDGWIAEPAKHVVRMGEEKKRVARRVAR